MEYYTVFRLKRFDVWTVYLFLLCFIHHRYRRYCDNLLACFIYHVRKYSDETKEVGKDRVYQEKMEMHQNMPKIGSILKLFTQDTIEDDESFRYVRGRAYAILPKEKIDQVANHIAAQILFDEKLFQWEHIDALRFQFKKYLRPVLSAIEFRGLSGQQDLLKGVDFLKDVIEKERPIGNYPMHKIPVTFISPGHHRYLMAGRKQEKQILPNRYEFHLCRQLCNSLESGDIYCSDSIRFRSFEDDLVNSSIWKKYKPDLIEQAGLPLLKLPVEEHLDILEDEYETLIRGINMRIDAEKNSGIKIKTKNGNLSWHLTYPKQEDETNHPFFNAIEQVDIGSVLEFVDTQCRFTEAFTHVLGRYTKSKGYDKSLMASIIAWGTNTGLGKMGQISDISYNSLKTTSDNFIRLETLRDANDCIVNAIKKLPITQEYNLDGLIHSSSDGQKFETAWPTINARHSPKYFGLKKGIVAFALTANNIALNADVIGANEHESHYVFDIIHNNTSDIDPDIHSTDTHGTNQVNFAILNMFGYQFAPRYKNFPAKVTSSLVGFQPIESYKGLIKPARQISKTRIIKNWDMIQRIMVSLALKSATQSIIVGKLNAYSRKNDIRNALWEYDAIFGSLYFLRYIDDPILRKHVETALNRGENYNKLRKAVAFSNFGRLRFKNEQEQKLWQECCRLITNCIIYYNATILSEVKIYKERVGDVEGLSQLRKISLVAWQHINLQGRYKFKTSRELIKMSRIIQQIMAVM